MSGYYIKQPPIASSHSSVQCLRNKRAKITDATVATCNTAAAPIRLFQITSSFLLLLLLNLSISHIPRSWAFNLENRLPIVKYGPHTNSYFGYSIATHTVGEYNWPNNTKWLLVGAPLDKNLQPGTNQTGALYRCPITQTLNDCEQIITDGRRSYDSDDIEELQEPSDDEIKEGQWLGVTVRSQGLGGKVLVCAHRYITTVLDNRYGQGLCYVLTNELSYDEVYEPCKGRTVQREHEEYGFCQVGTSGALLDDNTMVVGAPGPFTWRGTVFVTEIGGEYLERDKTMYYGDHLDNTSPVDKYSYLGMAVTGGRYFGERMSYASGAPRSNGHGQVVIFNKANTNPIPVKMILEGEQFGSSFGYELTTADINGDQKPDLIVAAPFYFNKSEGGAVYIYQNEKDMLPAKPTLKLTGTVESQFGLALANIGDINKDNCEDLAVGAPYEDDGVVYIYLGSRTGLISKPAQRIQASDLGLLPDPLVTFGSSISGGTDLDGNSYPDVVVGAYNSSAVVALLSRPIINIQTTARGNELRNIDPAKSGCLHDASTNLTCFTFEACCSIDPYEPASANKDLRLLYTVEAETFGGNKKFSRVLFDRDNKRSNVVKRAVTVRTNGRMACQQVTGYIKENTRDIQSPIKFRLNYTIVEPKLPRSGLELLNPILDQTQAFVEFEGTFQKDCGEDDICESDLILNAELDLNMENDNYALVLGEKDEMRVNVNVLNKADSAYETQLFVVHQKSVSYIAAKRTNSVICNRFNDTVVACSLGNPMRRNSAVYVSLRFDPSGLEVDERKLSFHVFANTTSRLIGDVKPDTELEVRVVKRAELSLQGWAKPEQSFYSGEVKKDSKVMQMEDVGSPLMHTYQIYNDGPWKAPKVVLTIYWPHQLTSEKSKKDKWLLYIEAMPIVENVELSECFVAPEYVNPLKLASKTKSDELFDTLLMAPAPYMMRPTNKTQYFNRYSTYSEKSVYTKQKAPQRPGLYDADDDDDDDDEERYLNRVRRNTIERIIRPERFMDIGGEHTNRKRDIVELDCNKATASCVKIQCDIYNMPAKTEAYVHIRARLWNSTLVSEYPRADLVRIMSRAQVKIPLEYSVEQTEAHILVETRAYPELLDQQREQPTSIWIYIVAIICGLIVLAVVVFVLWHLGFFKRRRPDPTLSGNLVKKSEEKPFLNDATSNGRGF
ncbi:integrin alpha-PS1 isoform X3 [Rhagoletis pomonella]|uniref:integrin alpha-PS1 isoform X2 n=1 Tax=Rhagoletis pomonella TaxID=28610 RepID=UPI001784DDC1|nr:integrin alpha-PS1 isoform X2 [Rhagoletis pomonella]XP_036318658.1 integrin alpha-PS1 isoform X3 [Rhagoletis pomonella]